MYLHILYLSILIGASLASLYLIYAFLLSPYFKRVFFENFKAGDKVLIMPEREMAVVRDTFNGGAVVIFFHCGDYMFRYVKFSNLKHHNYKNQ